MVMYEDLERRPQKTPTLAPLFAWVLVLGVLSTLLAAGVTTYCSALN